MTSANYTFKIFRPCFKSIFSYHGKFFHHTCHHGCTDSTNNQPLRSCFCLHPEKLTAATSLYTPLEILKSSSNQFTILRFQLFIFGATLAVSVSFHIPMCRDRSKISGPWTISSWYTELHLGMETRLNVMCSTLQVIREVRQGPKDFTYGCFRK